MSKSLKKSVKHKYGAKRTELHGKKFPSRLEARICDHLEKYKARGDILFYLWQVPIHISGFKPHRVDFLVFTETEALFIEAKGRDLAAGKTMRQLAEAEIDCQIHVVTCVEELHKLFDSIKS